MKAYGVSVQKLNPLKKQYRKVAFCECVPIHLNFTLAPIDCSSGEVIMTCTLTNRKLVFPLLYLCQCLLGYLTHVTIITIVSFVVANISSAICYWHIDIGMLQALLIFFIAARISRGFILLACQLPLAPVRGLIPCRAQQQQFINALDTLYSRGVEETRIGMFGFSMLLWVFSRALRRVPLEYSILLKQLMSIIINNC